MSNICFFPDNMAYRYVGLIFAVLSVLKKNRRPFFWLGGGGGRGGGRDERGLISRTVVIESNRGLAKICCGIRENASYIERKRDLTATREAGFTTKFGHGMWEFFFLWSEIREIEKWEIGKCETTRWASVVSYPILSCLPLRFFLLSPSASSSDEGIGKANFQNISQKGQCSR